MRAAFINIVNTAATAAKSAFHQCCPPQQTRTNGLLCTLVIVSSLLFGCTSTTQQLTTDDGLSAVNSSMDELFIRNASHFEQYQYLYFEPLSVSYSQQKRSDSLNRRAEAFQFDDREMAMFEARFRSGFSQQWQQTFNWITVDQPGVGVLVVRASVSDLFLYASIKNDSSSPTVTLANETSKMTLQIELLDGANQQVLLRMRDKKTTGRPNTGSRPITRVSSVSYWHDVKRMFRQTANTLSRFLGA